MQLNHEIPTTPYGIRVSDSPYYSPGSVVVADPDAPPVRGDHALVWLNDQESPVIVELGTAPPPVEFESRDLLPVLMIQNPDREGHLHQIDYERVHSVHKIIGEQ